MGKGMKILIDIMVRKRYIGNKHFPERALMLRSSKGLSRQERKEFEDEYKSFLNGLFLTKLKKRTGKGSEWHISINPDKVKEIEEMSEGENG